MPDGGYLRLSELEKFYENNNFVRGDPQQVAKYFFYRIIKIEKNRIFK